MAIEKTKGLLMLVGLGALLLPCAAARAGDARESQHPSLAGRWELIPEQSDDPGKAVEFLVAPPRPDAEGRRAPFGGGVGRGGPGGFPGGRGGWGGGGGGGRGGWGRGGPEGRAGADELKPPSEEERVAMRDAVRGAVEGGPTMEIVENGSDIRVQLPERRARRVVADGHKMETGRVVQQAAWKKEQLEIRTETRRLKIKETWSLEAQSGQLRIEMRAHKQDFDGELVLKRVYRKATAPASAVPPAAAASPESGT
jgi:hypothetical protein